MNELPVRTCISASGEFVYGIHKPDYTVINLREKDHITTLGHIDGKTAVENKINFPANDVTIDNADCIEKNGQILNCELHFSLFTIQDLTPVLSQVRHDRVLKTYGGSASFGTPAGARRFFSGVYCSVLAEPGDGGLGVFSSPPWPGGAAARPYL